MFTLLLKNVQTILGILFEHKELVCIIIVTIFTIIGCFIAHNYNKISNINNKYANKK